MSLVGAGRPHSLYEVSSPDDSGRFVVVVVDCCMLCRQFFSAGSCNLVMLALQKHAQVMPPCDYVANTMRLL